MNHDFSYTTTYSFTLLAVTPHISCCLTVKQLKGYFKISIFFVRGIKISEWIFQNVQIIDLFVNIK